MRENESFEVLVPLGKKPPHLPRDIYDELTWVIKIPQKWLPVMLPLFSLSTKNGSRGLAGMKGWKGPCIKNGTLSIKAGFLPSLCVITCTRQLCSRAYLVYTACLAAWLSPCKASLHCLLLCLCLSWRLSLVCLGCRGQPWKRRR